MFEFYGVYRGSLCYVTSIQPDGTSYVIVYAETKEEAEHKFFEMMGAA